MWDYHLLMGIVNTTYRNRMINVYTVYQTRKKYQIKKYSIAYPHRHTSLPCLHSTWYSFADSPTWLFDGLNLSYNQRDWIQSNDASSRLLWKPKWTESIITHTHTLVLSHSRTRSHIYTGDLVILYVCTMRLIEQNKHWWKYLIGNR